MTITEGIIVALIAVVSGVLTQLFGLYRWRKEQPAQEKKTGAESQNLLGEAAESISSATKTMVDALSARVKALEDDKTERDGYIEALEDDIRRIKVKVTKLELENEELLRQSVLKDNRIAELEQKTTAQETEIAELRKQIEAKSAA
jgi:predicted RNase H-like nuclease (RuvC/YqgF family)